MKRIISQGFLKFIVFLEILLLLGALLLYLLSSPKTLTYAVDRATEKFDIQYDSVSGNFLKTISLSNLRYQGNLLAKEAKIDWNMRALLRGEIEIETLILENIDIQNIQTLIKRFDHNQTQTSAKKSDLPSMSISHLSLTTLPYHDSWIDLKKLQLDIYDIAKSKKDFKVKRFAIESDSNFVLLKTSGYLKDKKLYLENSSLDKINLSAILELIKKLPKNREQNSSDFDIMNAIYIQELDASLLPYKIKNLDIQQLNLHAKEIETTLFVPELNTTALELSLHSNIANMDLSGDIQTNHLHAAIELKAQEEFFKQYTSIINFKNFNPLLINLDADQKIIDATVHLQNSQLFAGKFSKYPTQIKRFKSHIQYDLKSHALHAVSDANISTKYASSLLLHDTLDYDDKLTYSGTIMIAGLNYFPKHLMPIFEHGIAHYHGDIHDFNATLKTDKATLHYAMKEFKEAAFTLDSQELLLKDYYPKIATFLQPLQASLHATMQMEFKHALPLKINTEISSNLLDIEGVMHIKKKDTIFVSKSRLSQNSYFHKIDKNIQVQNIFPADLNLTYHDKKIAVTFLSPKTLLSNQLIYDINQSTIDETCQVNHTQLTLKGSQNALQLKTSISSLKTLQEDLQPLYSFKKEPYDGEVNIEGILKNSIDFEGDIESRWLVYEYALNKFAFAEKIKMHLKASPKNILLENYNLHAFLDEDRTFYAKKPSKISFLEGKIFVDSLWVNDGIKNQGSYDGIKKVGHFSTIADHYHYKGKEGDILLSANIQTDLSNGQTNIEGNVAIHKGTITYQQQKMHDIQDPDIIIIQEEKARLAAQKEKKNNLSLNIAIHTDEPLHYHIPKVDIYVSPDIKIWKEKQKELELLGRVNIHRGLYIESSKEFKIQPGEILFGGDPLNPFLNIKATHTHDPYIIDIDVVGTLDAPIINFSSNPYLSQSDILSMLLFSSTTDALFEGSSSSSNQALSMLGNTFAKEIVKNLGITLDKLVISTNEEGGLGIEVGKKISKKVTVIYINDVVQSIKVRYQHSPRFETDLMLSPESSGIDFIFKSEH